MLLSKILRAADHPYLMGKGGRMVRIELNLKNYKKNLKEKYIFNLEQIYFSIWNKYIFQFETNMGKGGRMVRKKLNLKTDF